MATSSTYVAFKQQLVSELTDALATSGRNGGPVQVKYYWPSTETEPDAVFFGRPQDLPPESVRIESDIPNIKAGRKQRQESYVVEMTVQTVRNDLNPDEAATAEAWGFSLLEKIDDLLANTPKVVSSILWAKLTNTELVGGGPIPEGKGFRLVYLVSIEVQARLT